MYHIIYKTVRPSTGEYYYGIHSTNDLLDGYQGSGKRIKRLLKRKEHLITGIVSFHSSREELCEQEAAIVTSEMLKDPLCLNIAEGGQNGIRSQDIGLRIQKGINSMSSEKKEAHKANVSKARNSKLYGSQVENRLETLSKQDSTVRNEWLTRMRQSNKDSYTEERRDEQSTFMKEYNKSLTPERKEKISSAISNSKKGKIWVVNEKGISYMVADFNDERLLNNGPWQRGKKWKN